MHVCRVYIIKCARVRVRNACDVIAQYGRAYRSAFVLHLDLLYRCRDGHHFWLLARHPRGPVFCVRVCVFTLELLPEHHRAIECVQEVYYVLRVCVCVYGVWCIHVGTNARGNV